MLSFQKQTDAYTLFDSQDGSIWGRLRAVLVRPGNDSYWRPSSLRPIDEGNGSLAFASRSGAVTASLTFSENRGNVLVGTAEASGMGYAIVPGRKAGFHLVLCAFVGCRLRSGRSDGGIT